MLNIKRNAAYGLGVVLVLLLASPLFIILILFNAWVLTKLWLWFMVPGFGLPTISYPLAIGLALVVNFLKPGPVDYAKEHDSTPASRFWQILAHPFVTLALGWIASRWM